MNLKWNTKVKINCNAINYLTYMTFLAAPNILVSNRTNAIGFQNHFPQQA